MVKAISGMAFVSSGNIEGLSTSITIKLLILPVTIAKLGLSENKKPDKDFIIIKFSTYIL